MKCRSYRIIKANDVGTTIYVKVRKHAARAVGDLEGRCRGVTPEHSGRFLESRGGGSVSEQRRDSDGRKYNGSQPQGISLYH